MTAEEMEKAETISDTVARAITCAREIARERDEWYRAFREMRKERDKLKAVEIALTNERDALRAELAQYRCLAEQVIEATTITFPTTMPKTIRDACSNITIHSSSAE